MTDGLVILRQVAYAETPDVEGRNGDGPPEEDPDAPDVEGRNDDGPPEGDPGAPDDDDGAEDEHDPDATPSPGGEDGGADEDTEETPQAGDGASDLEDIVGIIPARPAEVDLLDEESSGEVDLRTESGAEDGAGESALQQTSDVFGDPEDVMRRIRRRRPDDSTSRRQWKTTKEKPQYRKAMKPTEPSGRGGEDRGDRKRSGRLRRGAQDERVKASGRGGRAAARRDKTATTRQDRDKARNRAPPKRPPARMRKSLYVDDEAGVEGGKGDDSEELSESEISGSFIDRDSEPRGGSDSEEGGSAVSEPSDEEESYEL